MKLTKKQINMIREHTPEELRGKFDRVEITLGHYQKPGANWSYCAGWNKAGQLIVTVFGEVQ